MAASMYEIDWVAAGSWAQALAGPAGAGAVVGAVLVGRSSFGDWLKQRRTERRLEVGERILTFAHKAKAAFLVLRSPGMTDLELQQAEREIAEVEHLQSQRSDLLSSLITLGRMRQYENLWKELYECQTLAQIFFGPEEAV
jgi:hypothetical protein